MAGERVSVHVCRLQLTKPGADMSRIPHDRSTLCLRSMWLAADEGHSSVHYSKAPIINIDETNTPHDGACRSHSSLKCDLTVASLL